MKKKLYVFLMGVLLAIMALCCVGCSSSTTSIEEEEEVTTKSYSTSGSYSSNYSSNSNSSNYSSSNSSNSYSTYDDEPMIGAGGYEMPNESDKTFSDYVKRVDPDLYNEMEDIFESMK